MSDPHAAKPVAPDDEPKTPMWLPALGAALFVSVGLWWAVTPAEPPPVDAGQAASASASAAAPPAPQPMPQPQPAMPRPTASAAAAPPMPSGGAVRQRKGGRP